jgi:hypothetical protein
MLTCLICGGDMQRDTAEVTELLRECGCIGTTVDSAGREFQFADGERLEVGGMCNSCDENEIRRFLESR